LGDPKLMGWSSVDQRTARPFNEQPWKDGDFSWQKCGVYRRVEVFEKE